MLLMTDENYNLNYSNGYCLEEKTKHFWKWSDEFNFVIKQIPQQSYVISIIPQTSGSQFGFDQTPGVQYVSCKG